MEIKKLKEDAADMIVDAVKFAAIAGVNASDCGVELSTSLYLNIRDAMFHYKALCDYFDEDSDSALKHYFCLREHLLRGEKDAVITQAHAIVNALLEIMQQRDFDDEFDSDELRLLQQLDHKVKNVILMVRTSGANLSDGKGFSIGDAWTELVNYTISIVQICRNKNISLF